MHPRILDNLYNATEEDLLYGIGQLGVPDGPASPLIHIHYRHWSRRKLDIVRASLRDGITLTIEQSIAGSHALHIATHECISVQVRTGDHTSVLRAPAWDAHLTDIEEEVVRQFIADQRACDGHVLLLQTPVWDLLCGFDTSGNVIRIGDVTPRTAPIPGESTTE